ncbi:MAG: FIST N-terminal domain-containing protein [Lachnospiraceae bacterium]|nr:FIST N-terminal domain-containing protein [Lachnospiraceae bacterium]
MKIDQLIYWKGEFDGDVTIKEEAQWVLVFGSSELIQSTQLFDEIRTMYPNSYIMGCSSGGEIFGAAVIDDMVIITAVHLEKSSVKFSRYDLSDGECASQIGKKIMDSIVKEDLKHVFVLSEGLNMNGSKLVEGLRENNETHVPITGGLSADKVLFKNTYIIANDYAKQNQIVVAAFYGDIKTGCASMGGWDTFGIERIVTKADGNVLYEMDGKPVLDLYKEYLGDLANDLSKNVLLFPLSIRERDSGYSFVRTVAAIDEEKKSLAFAGDIPVGSYCRLMKSNPYNLVEGSKQAISLSKEMIGESKIDLAILISCIGRKLVLKQMVDDEVQVVEDTVGKDTAITGFYSYGEISPYQKDTTCEFHNQTMTITLLTEE